MSSFVILFYYGSGSVKAKSDGSFGYSFGSTTLEYGTYFCLLEMVPTVQVWYPQKRAITKIVFSFFFKLRSYL
jgi:hypothetical protein